jgi:hypothetical protein
MPFTTTIDVRPGTLWKPASFTIKLQIPSAKATNETKKPRGNVARSGVDEKLITPVEAKRSIFLSGYFVSPANRS